MTGHLGFSWQGIVEEEDITLLDVAAGTGVCVREREWVLLLPAGTGLCMYECGGEREQDWERQTDRPTDRDRPRKKKTDRQKERDWPTDTHTNRPWKKHAHKHTLTRTHTQLTYTQTLKQTRTQAHSHTYPHPTYIHTGRQHTFLKDNWPKMKTVCSDMSPFYLQEAYENMEYFAEYTKSGDISSITLTLENFSPARARTRRFWYSSLLIYTRPTWNGIFCRNLPYPITCPAFDWLLNFFGHGHSALWHPPVPSRNILRCTNEIFYVQKIPWEHIVFRRIRQIRSSLMYTTEYVYMFVYIFFTCFYVYISSKKPNQVRFDRYMQVYVCICK